MNYNTFENNDTSISIQKIESLLNVNLKFTKNEIEINSHHGPIYLREIISAHYLPFLNNGEKLDEIYFSDFHNKFNDYIIWQLFKFMGNDSLEYLREYEKRNRYYERKELYHLIPFKDSLGNKHSIFENIISDIMFRYDYDDNIYFKLSLEQVLFEILIERCWIDKENLEKLFIPKDECDTSYPIFRSFIKTLSFMYNRMDGR